MTAVACFGVLEHASANDIICRLSAVVRFFNRTEQAVNTRHQKGEAHMLISTHLALCTVALCCKAVVWYIEQYDRLMEACRIIPSWL